jgi:hypothetical protein
MCCFLAHEDIRLDPTNTAKPPVDLLSSTLPAQSAYEKALTSVESNFRTFSPRFVVYFIYLKILLTTAQWNVVGA